MNWRRCFGLASALLIGLPSLQGAWAAPLKAVTVAPSVYALVGELGQRSPENTGNNATFGAVLTPDGFVLIDSGGSRQGAQVIERALKSIADKPVIVVINTGGQDHRWLGNAYFKGKGARLIASARAVQDQKERSDQQFQMMSSLIGAKNFAGTKPAYADELFDAPKEISIGGTLFRLIPAGPAHTPGDSIVWLPKQQVAFTGDIVFTERMLGVLEVSRSKNWLAAFETLAALKPLLVVPGHGHPVLLAQAKADTYDYLVYLRQEVGRLLAGGGNINAAAEIGQSAFLHLQMSDQLAKRNAMQVFSEMEFE